jgi:hypothetical protein
MLKYIASPTGDKFLKSKAFLKLIMGPVGGGKSTVALMDLWQRAVSQTDFGGTRRSKWGILRNTNQQLKATVKPLIDAWLVEMPMKLGGAPLGHWRLTDNVFEMRFRLADRTIVHAELLLLACDEPQDVRRLLSLELSGAWVEEAREIGEEIISGLQGRVARFPSRAQGGVNCPGVIFSTNPPPQESFWHEFITDPPKTAEIFLQPPAMLEDGQLNPDAENIENLDPLYYERIVEGKKPGWIDVYIKNNFGAGEYGNPVYKDTFKRSFHVASSELTPIPQSLSPLIVGCDNGLTAAATIGQRDAKGRVNVFAECFVPEGDSYGFETFLDRQLLPMIRLKFPQFRPENVVFSMDPACFSRSQVDEKTLAQAVQKRGFSAVRAYSNDPDKRIGAVEALLGRQIDGGPGFLIDPGCKALIKGFEFAYRFRKAQAHQSAPTPDKNHAANLADSCQYMAMAFETGVSVGYGKPSTARKQVKAAYTYV